MLLVIFLTCDICSALSPFWPAEIHHAQGAERKILAVYHRETGIAGPLLHTLKVGMILPCRVFQHVFHEERFAIKKDIGADIQFTRSVFDRV